MKRSEINKALKELEVMCAREHCYLPPFCHFTPEEWKTKGPEYDEVRDCMLGWDITDYGLGDFDKVGMSLITIRNGNRAMQDKYPKVYAEKLLYMKEGQYSPNHFHWYKPKEKVTYKMIKEYIEAKYGFKVHTAYIAEVKRNLGLPMYDAPNAVEELKQPRKHPTPEKVEAIKDALRYFAVI